MSISKGAVQNKRRGPVRLFTPRPRPLSRIEILEKNLELLGFTPDIYSPYFLLCTPALVTSLREQNIRLIPWTVNETKEMERLIEMGVDGIITDYPDRIPKKE